MLPDSLKFAQDHVLLYKDGTEVPHDFDLVSRIIRVGLTISKRYIV